MRRTKPPHTEPFTDTLTLQQEHDLLEMFWDSMRREPGHPDRKQTGIGSKTKEGLLRTIETMAEPKTKKFYFLAFIDGQFTQHGPFTTAEERATAAHAITKESDDVDVYTFSAFTDIEFDYLPEAE